MSVALGHRRVACITMAYNEGVRLALWVDYYGKNFGLENLFVIDDSSTDGSVNLSDVNVIKVPKLPFDDERRVNFVSKLHSSLLEFYDLVIFTDTDEILVADPGGFASLRDYCDGLKHRWVTAIGFNVYHVPQYEPAELDWRCGVLKQRSYGRFSSAMCKTLLSSVPLRWSPGFHGVSPGCNIDSNLYLFHLKHADRDFSFNRLKITRGMDWCEKAVKYNWGAHQRMDDEAFERSFNSVVSMQPVEGDFKFHDDLNEVISGINKSEDGIFTLKSNVNGRLIKIPQKFCNVF